MAESVFPPSRHTVVAFRAHLWDAPIAGLARRMQAACPQARFVVLADETNGQMDVWPFEKISHSADMAEFGLPSDKGVHTLWFNADYAIYALAKALPGYDHYVLAEYDVAVNIDIDAIMESIRERGLDMVAYLIQAADPGWSWYHTVAGSFATPRQALIPFLVLSRAAIDRLLEARRDHAALQAAGELAEWAYCEGFIPSVICNDPALRWAELTEFAELPHFGYRPFQLLGEQPERLPGTIAHPVLSAERMFPLQLAGADMTQFAHPQSDIRTRIARFPLAQAAPFLQSRLIRAGHAGAIAAFRAMLRAAGLRPDRTLFDLALAKPALQSAISAYSRGKTPAEDAAFLVSGEMAEDYGNHTDSIAPIWWMVDLGEAFVIDEVRIVNRPPPGASDRFLRFSIDTSLDGANWTGRYIKLDGTPVSHDPEAPFTVAFSPPCVGRFVRLNQLGAECIHLRRVHVYGRAIVPLDERADGTPA